MQLGPFGVRVIGREGVELIKKMQRLIAVRGKDKTEALLNENAHIRINPKKKHTNKGE